MQMTWTNHQFERAEVVCDVGGGKSVKSWYDFFVRLAIVAVLVEEKLRATFLFCSNCSGGVL